MVITDREFYVSAVVGLGLAMIVSAIRYLNNVEVTVWGIIFIFLYGVIVGIVGQSPHTSFGKNLLFMSMIGLLIWTFLSPVTSIGGTTVIKNLEFWLMAVLVIAFLERETLNALGRVFHWPASSHMAFIGTLAFMYWFVRSPLWQSVWKVVADLLHWLTLALLIWFVLFFIIFSKSLSKTSDKVSSYYGKPAGPHGLHIGDVFWAMKELVKAWWELPLLYKIAELSAIGFIAYKVMTV